MGRKGPTAPESAGRRLRLDSSCDARRASGGDIDHQGCFGEACGEIGCVAVHTVLDAGIGEAREGEDACWQLASGAMVVLGGLHGRIKRAPVRPPRTSWGWRI